MDFSLIVLPGDGVGPEVIDDAVKVLKAVGKKFGHRFNLNTRLVGGAAIDAEGVAVSKATVNLCKKADAVLLGAVGGPKWDDPLAKVRPEDGLLELRKSLGLFANLRPVKVHPVLVDSTNLKPEVIKGVDFIFVRELTGGLYFGKPKRRWQTESGRKAVDSMLYSEQEIERIVRVGFELARHRQKKLISVDKANVLESSRLWRQVALEVANDYPDISLEHMLVDACSMRIIQNPRYLDVLVTENTFGDILTDEASMLAGSMGMLPSASIAGVPQAGVKIFGLYEPIHGSAPRRAGQNIANPIATILSAAMMLRYSFALEREAEVVEKAVEDALNEGYRTYDIMSENKTRLGTKEMGDIIAGKVGG
ncbi:MAG: 3-isopropylmalate dehydrogenase [Chloroflexi bacterium RBG_13_51_52]|nr:MAG: 3-isopropylmalate dehydrogenase [Chloroflexi bacterium RBG_13_51_52]